MASALILTGLATGCSSFTRNAEGEATANDLLESAEIRRLADSASPTEGKPGGGERDQASDLKRAVMGLSSRLDAIEARLARIDEKADAATVSRFNSVKARASAVAAHPSEGAGASVEAAEHEADPDLGFVNDTAVSTYRKAMVNFRASRFSEAILGFSSFLERFADHPLAGAAQFHVGESYLRQKEYALALQEFQRVVTSYDRSSHVSDSLRQMALAADRLRKPEEAAGYRQQLMSMFPQSPAAARGSTVEETPAQPEIRKATGTLPRSQESETPSPTDPASEIEAGQTDDPRVSSVGSGLAPKLPALRSLTGLDLPPLTDEVAARAQRETATREPARTQSGNRLDQPPPTAPLTEAPIAADHAPVSQDPE